MDRKFTAIVGVSAGLHALALVAMPADVPPRLDLAQSTMSVSLVRVTPPPVQEQPVEPEPEPVLKPLPEPPPPPPKVKPAPRPLPPLDPNLAAAMTPPLAAPRPITVEPSRPVFRPEQPDPIERREIAPPTPPVIESQGAQTAHPPSASPRNKPPVYPRRALRQRLEGTVELELQVTRHGKVTDVKLLRSSGYDVLDEAAIKTVRQWVFHPATRAGRPINYTLRQPVRFELR